MMLTLDNLRSLLIKAQSHQVLIITSTAVQARLMQNHILSEVEKHFPRFLSSRSRQMHEIYLNAHERIIIATAEQWNQMRYFRFPGKVYYIDDMGAEEYSPLYNVEQSPEPLIKSLEVRCYGID